MKGTSLASLQVQVHCNEMPLQLRRLKLQIQYAVKVSAKVFEDHWTQHYGKFTERNQTIAAKVSNFFDKYKEVNVESLRVSLDVSNVQNLGKFVGRCGEREVGNL